MANALQLTLEIHYTGLSRERFAQIMGMNLETFENKLTGGGFTIKEVSTMVKLLDLSPETATRIFFG